MTRTPLRVLIVSNASFRIVCLANCNFASHRTCHNVTPHRCMLFISKAVLILAKHRRIIAYFA